MEDKLIINTKLWGKIDEVIGRRDYFLNSVYIWIITTLLVFPYTVWLMIHLQSYMDLFTPFKMFVEAPLFIKFFMVSTVIVSSILYVNNIFRRLNDINGKINTGANAVCAILMILPSFAIFVPSLLILLSGLVSFIIGAVLLFKKGKITSQLPYDYTKEFNWGAFFGTWIWGLFNKSYIPLWMLILFFTPVGFYFQLICGLKGNEWAYKNKGWSDVNQFNKNQEKQTAIFTILMVIVLPILYFLLVFGTLFYFVSSSSPDTQAKLEKAANYLSNMAMSSFDSYEITENENIFFVDGKKWEFTSFSDKKDLLDFAATKASVDRNNALPENSKEHYSKMSELPRTKIYDTESHVLLAEFEEPQLGENPSFSDFFKAAMKAYKFYNIE